MRVIGIGNELRRDDGFGPVVARELQVRDLPAGVAVADYGTRVVHLAFDLAQAPGPMVFIDAADMGAEPGTVAVIEPSFPDEIPAMSSHDITLAGVAAMVRRLGSELRDVVLVGCQPLDTTDGIGLTEVVARAVPAAVDCVLDVVRQQLGHGTIENRNDGKTT